MLCIQESQKYATGKKLEPIEEKTVADVSLFTQKLNLKLFRDVRTLGILLTNSSLLAEARKIAEGLKTKDFVGTPSRLEEVKRRNEICYRKSTRVNQKLPEKASILIEQFKDKG